jgi:hypothetical protein
VIERHCPVCGATLVPAEEEGAKHFALRITCGERKCVSALRIASCKRAATERDQPPEGPVPTDRWPAEMALTRPFADDVRTTARGSIGLPATLAGGCSSSSGWGVK